MFSWLLEIGNIKLLTFAISYLSTVRCNGFQDASLGPLEILPGNASLIFNEDGRLGTGENNVAQLEAMGVLPSVELEKRQQRVCPGGQIFVGFANSFSLLHSSDESIYNIVYPM